MYVAAARAFGTGTWLATGQRPVLSPPLSFDQFDPASLEGHRVIYLCLHGIDDGVYLYGDGGLPTMYAGQIARAHLDGAVVFLAGCWGAGPVSDAFLKAGAVAVVGDSDINRAGRILPTGSNLLGRYFLDALSQPHTGPMTALELAKESYRKSPLRWLGRGIDHEALLATVGIVGSEVLA